MNIDEPLLSESVDRYVMFPIEYSDIWMLCIKKQIDCFLEM
jgi:hypothetical protein